ncbi:MAG: pyridoxamine 5'-phosphate oxidase family protein [Chloroflexi bacterium]|nr:pyridoxamine 5'-phosphate oxidase family protein [Chloroflexota bacterium]
MVELTGEMKDLVDNALANGTPCILGTASPTGEPHVGFRGSMMVFDKEHLAYWERTRGQELRLVEINPRVVVMLRNSTRRLGWKFYGFAAIHTGGPIREQVMGRVVAPELARDPEKKGVAVLIKVHRITDLSGRVLQESDQRGP